MPSVVCMQSRCIMLDVGWKGTRERFCDVVDDAFALWFSC